MDVSLLFNVLFCILFQVSFPGDLSPLHGDVRFEFTGEDTISECQIVFQGVVHHVGNAVVLFLTVQFEHLQLDDLGQAAEGLG